MEPRRRGPTVLPEPSIAGLRPAMSLKIIAGEYRGRVLRSVKGFMTRPLLGQVREALFNILGDRVVDEEDWDLFAGTGATGHEALSRGARRGCQCGCRRGCTRWRRHRWPCMCRCS